MKFISRQTKMMQGIREEINGLREDIRSIRT